jgi:aspartyl-tRNA(Asn)/glutamyl-tRNA(Gln) amidotransferase subunit B
MEEGSLRCDANVSLRPIGARELGVKTEVKNVNSFRFLQKALEFEIARQTTVLQSGDRVHQETRLWDADRGETFSMRSKEEARDYRYFPEPDLPPVIVSAAMLADIRAKMPELPDDREARFAAQYGLTIYDASVLVRVMPGAASYFEQTVAAGAPAKVVSNWIQGEIRRKLKESGHEDVAATPVSPARLAGLIAEIESGRISTSAAKAVFEAMWTSDRSAQDIVDAEGLAQIGDESALAAMVDDVIAAHPDEVAQIRAGRNNVFGFLVGLVMKASGGKANPKTVTALLRQRVNPG